MNLPASSPASLSGKRKGDYCYFWSEERKNLFDVEDTCISIGGHLPSIATWDINNCMMRKKDFYVDWSFRLEQRGGKEGKVGGDRQKGGGQ